MLGRIWGPDGAIRHGPTRGSRLSLRPFQACTLMPQASAKRPQSRGRSAAFRPVIICNSPLIGSAASKPITALRGSMALILFLCYRRRAVCGNVSGIETVAARFGYAWDRSWIYAKAGGALVQDQFTVDANTQAYALTRGGGLFGWGLHRQPEWAGADFGVGLEYALCPDVSAKLEYDYIALAKGTADFNLASALPSDVLIAPNSTISQNVQEVKFGVNYRFGSENIIVTKF